MVDAVAKAGHLLFLGQHSFDVFDWVGAVAIDGNQDMKDCFIGATVERAFQGADGRRDGRVHIGEGGGGDAGGEGRGVQFVIGMEDKSDIERTFRSRRRSLAVEHQEEVGGVGKRAVGLDNVLAFADAIVGGDDHGDLRGQADCLVDVGIVIVALKLGIVKGQSGDGGAENVHRAGMTRSIAEQADDGCVELTLFGHAIAKFTQLLALGKAAEPEQVAGFLEVGVFGEVVNIDPAIGEDALLAIDVTDAGCSCDDSFESLRGMG